MVSKRFKHCLSLALALLLSISLLPSGAIAVGDTEEPQETVVNTPAPSAAMQTVLTKMYGIMEYYLGTTDLTAEEAVALVAELDPYDTAAASMEIYEVEISEEFQQMTDSDRLILEEEHSVLTAFIDAVYEKAAREGAISTFANIKDANTAGETGTFFADANGKGLYITTFYYYGDAVQERGSGTVDTPNQTVQIGSKGGSSTMGQGRSRVYLTNTRDVAMKLTFYYETSGGSYQEFSESTGSGWVTDYVLEPGAQYSMYITEDQRTFPKWSYLDLSQFSFVEAKTNPELTVNFNSTYGKVTLDGTEITANSTNEVSLENAVTLVATAQNGGTFYGWVDTDGRILESGTTYSRVYGDDTTVKAVFAGGTDGCWRVTDASSATFKTGMLDATTNTYYKLGTGGYLFTDLTAAANYAENSDKKYIVPLKSCTLGAGTYTIPSGVTLLIPFDSENSLYTDKAEFVTTDFVQPSAYRTLTLASGTSLIINGSISISAKHKTITASSYCGSSPVGNVGWVSMEANSTITVNGSMYVYGYITGNGSVTVNNGGKVYELFQVADFRGGNQTADMLKPWLGSDSSNQSYLRVFPMSQYYVQNIEVPMTLNYGATEYCYTTISASGYNFGSAPILIGSDGGMFAMGAEGSSVTKWYDGSTDRLQIRINGSVNMKSVTLEMNGIQINSYDYVLPVTTNTTVTILSGASVSISEDVALLPGSEVIIDNGASVAVASGKNLFVYDADQWGNFCGSANLPFMALKYAPGREYNRTEADIKDAIIQVDGTVDMSSGNVYTTAGTPTKDNTYNVMESTDFTGGGANIFSTGTGVITLKTVENANTYQLIQTDDFYEIPVTSPKLKNDETKSADWPYTLTENSDSDTNTYTYNNTIGKWICETHTPGNAATCTTAQTCIVCGEVVAAALNHKNASWQYDTTNHWKYCPDCETISSPEEAHSFEDTVTAPTCTTAGYTTHTCECGYSEVDTYTAPTGHNWDEDGKCTTEDCGASAVASVNGSLFYGSVAEALEAAPAGATIKILAKNADTPAFNKRMTVDTGETGYTISCADGWEAVDSGNGFYSVQKKTDTTDGKFHISATNVNMGNNLDMLFAIPMNAVADWTGHYIEIVRGGSAESSEDETIRIYFDNTKLQEGSGITGTSDKGTSYSWYTNGNYYIITYGGFDAKEMADSITLTVKDSSGNAVSYPWTDSIRSYAMRILGTTKDGQQANVAIDMLNFGAAAQLHFNYGTNNLANSLLTAEQKVGTSHDPISDDLAEGSLFAGANLIVTSHIKYYVTFTGLTEGMTAKVEYTGHKGNTYSEQVELVTENGTNCFVVDGLVVADARYPVTITVTNSNGEVYTTCVDSIEAYISRKASESSVYNAFMKFADSAHRFKHNGAAE